MGARRSHPVRFGLFGLPVAVVAAALLVSGAEAPAKVTIENSWRHGAVVVTAIPLGDGHTSTTSPAVGSVYDCPSGGGVGGAEAAEPWLGTTTWNETEKILVQGSVLWPTAAMTERVTKTTRIITTNDLPVHEPTGTFPIATTDPASAYDTNPNHIAAHPTTVHLPLSPKRTATPSCVPDGPIGVMTDGVFLFDALDGDGRDAVAHELQDLCDGHPAPGNEYHYHDVSVCLLAKAKGASTLVGWAFDGYPIYVERDATGALPTDADLDVCHGRTSNVLLDGRIVRTYHYDATVEYPYTVGCFRAVDQVHT